MGREELPAYYSSLLLESLNGAGAQKGLYSAGRAHPKPFAFVEEFILLCTLVYMEILTPLGRKRHLLHAIHYKQRLNCFLPNSCDIAALHRYNLSLK